MKPTIVITPALLAKNNLTRADLVKIEALGEYGFDNEIIQLMIAYEIMPQTFSLNKKIYVIRKEVQQVLNSILHNTMVMYDMVEKKDELVAEATAKALAEAKPLSSLYGISSGGTDYNNTKTPYRAPVINVPD